MTMPQELLHLSHQRDWLAMIAHRPGVERMTGSNCEAALAFHHLGHAFWHAARDPFDLVEAIRLDQAAAQRHDLGGLVAMTLGIRLIAIGRHFEGCQSLHRWLSRFDAWAPQVQSSVGHVQYALGEAFRHQGDLGQAERAYEAALEGFVVHGNASAAEVARCTLASVRARLGQGKQAWATLDPVELGGQNEPLRLKAVTELLAAQGQHAAALLAGERASEALTASADPDLSEQLAELHALLAGLYRQAGNQAEQNRHLALVMEALRQAPRHELYRAATLLLEVRSD